MAIPDEYIINGQYVSTKILHAFQLPPKGNPELFTCQPISGPIRNYLIVLKKIIRPLFGASLSNPRDVSLERFYKRLKWSTQCKMRGRQNTYVSVAGLVENLCERLANHHCAFWFNPSFPPMIHDLQTTITHLPPPPCMKDNV